MDFNQDVALFIFRKISLVISILYSLYHVYKKKKITLHRIFHLIFVLFLTFSYTYTYSYDFLDKLIIFIIHPICFLVLSVLFFKKNDVDIKEKKLYILVFIFFVIVELLYFYRGNIFPRYKWLNIKVTVKKHMHKII